MNNRLMLIARSLSEEELEDYDGNEMVGGRADGMSLKDIADRYGVAVKDMLSELLLGIDEEMKHTNDETIAVEIALDNLFDIPDYYTRLKQMESDAESEWI